MDFQIRLHFCEEIDSVRSGENKLTDPRVLKRLLTLARLAGEIEMLRAGLGSHGRSRFGLLGIDFIRGAEAGKFGARFVESFGEVIATHFDRLDAASLKEALGEACARVEIGGAAKSGEKDFRPRARFRKIGIASVAQALEALGETDAGKGVRWRLDDMRSKRTQDRDSILVEKGKVAGADQRVVALGDILLAVVANFGDCRLNRAFRQCFGYAALTLDVLKQSPSFRTKRVGQRLDRA